MKEATPRQLEVLGHFSAFAEKHGVPPTLRELADLIGVRSTNGMNDHIRALEHKGYMEHRANKSRTIRLTPSGLALLGLGPTEEPKAKVIVVKQYAGRQTCLSCPFLRNIEDFSDCSISSTAGMSPRDVQRDMSMSGGPPSWCTLRTSPAIVRLSAKDA